MESLDTFRYYWQEEISKDKSNQSNSINNISHTPTGDLCRLGTKSKNSIECHRPIPPTSDLIRPTHVVNNNTSFTIGIRTFISSNSSSLKPTTNEPPSKKLKTSNLTLLDELIRDIDESTDVPFFNISLPREIALHIFDYLSIKDLYSCLQVCKSWHTLSCDELLWYNLYRRLKFNNLNKTNDDSWKDQVKEVILLNQQVTINFKNHQCRTTKLTNRLGIVLTCANNNQTTIVAGYSSGIVRTWSIEAVLDTEEDTEDHEQLDTPEIIYESTDTDQDTDLSSVRSVGLLKNDIYAMHDNGLLEIWTNDISDKPRFTQKLTSLPIKHLANDENILCAASRSKFSVWNFNEETPQYQELDFLNQFNDCIISFCMSSHHSVPISIVAANKSLWCMSLSNLIHRHSFYSILESDYVQKIPLDVHNDEPLAIVGLDREIKLFDLESGRCNIISTNYKNLPANIQLIRADKCPINEFVVAFDNYQISIFDRRQKEGAIQHFYNHYSTITTLQLDSWKLASTDTCGFVRLWDRRMNPHSLWHMNPQLHPVTHCSFDKQTLIFALTPYCKSPDMIDYHIDSDPLSGHVYVCDFKSDVSTQLGNDLKICTSSYDAPQASNRRIGLHTPYDIIHYDYQFRLIVVGDSTVGKSSLLRTFCDGIFSLDPDPTVGVDFHVRIVEVKPGIKVKLQLWDTAGQERFRSITRAYYRNSVGVLLIYDTTNYVSFTHVTSWLNDARQQIEPYHCVFLLVGTKIDRESERQVSTEEGKAFADFHNISFIETSSKSALYVQEAFALIAREIYDLLIEGRIHVQKGWDGVKAGPNVAAPAQNQPIDVTQNNQNHRSGCCGG
ncbi:unnamed protein product [Rotaria magnacalcarata]|uniref:F-box domain-containing protein n=5 Tax=Rotaria magnacalcarata TaxID=392030 RepID=A0A814HXG7_9BILA|nr:unnamed protein product [Rotaria magnacalcarata]CAF1686417.1 unnamed protein product [Rotaria magnacalcarata]